MSEQLPNQLHQELHAHANALRGLARDLLRDTHAAEDVTQQTLAKAWSVRDRLQTGPVGGWLHRTLTNFARQWRRGERRRTTHEARHSAAFATQSQPSPALTLARREALQSVTNAVLQLDEPYQTAVFLRYFEDLSPRQIAQRTNSNVATVKSRLARGLVMLRARLAQTQGEHDWRLALAGTLGLPLGGALLPLTTGFLLMKTSLKCTLAAAALCIGGFYLYQGEDPTPPTTAPVTNKTVTALNASDAPSDRQLPVADRSIANTPAREQALLTHPYELTLTVHVVDELGLPVSGYTPELGPLGGALRKAGQASDETGTAVVRWQSRQPQATIELLDPRRHRRSITVHHGQPNHVALLGSSWSNVAFALTDLDIRLVGIESSFNGLRQLGSSTSDQLSPGLHPHAVFSENGLITVNDEAPLEEVETALTNYDAPEIEIRSHNGATWSIQLSGLQLGGAATQKPTPPESQASITGFVYGEDGKAKGGVPLVLLGSTPTPLQRTTTDALGAFRFDKLLANTYQVRAGGTELGLATVTEHVVEGNYTLDLNLRREACIHGTLQDAAGQPVAEASIQWLSDDGQWIDQTTTQADGSFVLANLPMGSGQLLAWHSNQAWRYPIATLANVVPDSGGVAVTCDVSNSSKLRVQPSAAPECDLKDLRLRVRQVDTGHSRGISVPRRAFQSTDAAGHEIHSVLEAPTSPWELAALPAGLYEVEMWLAGCGSKSLGRHWLDGKSDVDLGTVQLAAPGRLHFEHHNKKAPEDLLDRPPEDLTQDLKVEICEIREPFDVRIETLASLSRDVQLAAGNYVLLIQRGAEPVQAHAFTVNSGNTTTLPLSW